MRTFADHTGKKFGKWSVLGYAGRQYWLCRCECGAQVLVYSGNLTSGGSTQCRKCANLKHGGE